MKIYRFGPDFYAAKNLRDAVREYVLCSGGTIREALEDVETLSDADLDSHEFVTDIYNPDECERISFREQLNRQIAEGASFPTAFASSDW